MRQQTLQVVDERKRVSELILFRKLEAADGFVREDLQYVVGPGYQIPEPDVLYGLGAELAP